MLGERRAHRGDDRLEPRLPQRDHVGVALDDDRPVLLRDRGPGEVEAVEDVALLEQLALGRVDVLALERVVVVELAGLEPDHPAARVGEREHQPRREVVVAALVRQPGRTQLVGGEALLARLRGEALPRREAEPELLRDLLAEPAAREVRAHGLPVGPLPEVALEERRPPGRARRRGAHAGAGTRRPAASSPRTRAGRGTARRATRSRRRSRGPPSRGRT